MPRVGTPKRSRPHLAHRTCARCGVTRSVEFYIGRGGTYANVCHVCLPPRAPHRTRLDAQIAVCDARERLTARRDDDTDITEPTTLEYVRQYHDRLTDGTWYVLR